MASETFTPMHRCWMKRMRNRRLLLRVAARLGRSRGRLRVLDRFTRPMPAPATPDLRGWETHELAAAWIGHATVLLRIGGMNVLTDPVFSTRVGIGLGLVTVGPRRRFAPALKLRDLPPIDLVLVSHAHFDHLDRPTLHRLPKSATVVVSEHNRDLVDDLGFARVVELPVGETAEVHGVRITAAPVQHWGARTVYDRHRGYCAYVLESNGRRVLFGGDTAYHEGFRAIGKVDAMIAGIGSYDPWVWNHADPEQAWRMSRHVYADAVIPVHHQTFRQSREPWDEPLERLLRAAGNEADRVVIRRIGGQWRA